MDRISGLMPQIGWSPVLMPVAPKHAPATTVEPAAKAANTNGGMGAEVDTQTGQDRAQQVQALQAQTQQAGLPQIAGGGLEQAVLSQGIAAAQAQSDPDSGPPPDPDAPTGPPPTFEMTPLEAEASRRKAVQSVAPVAADTVAPDANASIAPETEASVTAPPAANVPVQPDMAEAPADPHAAAPQGDWQTLDQTPEPSLDVTR